MVHFIPRMDLVPRPLGANTTSTQESYVQPYGQRGNRKLALQRDPKTKNAKLSRKCQNRSENGSGRPNEEKSIKSVPICAPETCRECFAPVCAHVSRRRVHSVPRGAKHSPRSGHDGKVATKNGGFLGFWSISFHTLSWLWCEALSAFGPKCKNMQPRISGKNFDLEFRVLILFHWRIEPILQTPEANTRSTQESYFQVKSLNLGRRAQTCGSPGHGRVRSTLRTCHFCQKPDFAFFKFFGIVATPTSEFASKT